MRWMEFICFSICQIRKKVLEKSCGHRRSSTNTTTCYHIVLVTRYVDHFDSILTKLTECEVLNFALHVPEPLGEVTNVVLEVEVFKPFLRSSLKLPCFPKTRGDRKLGGRNR